MLSSMSRAYMAMTWSCRGCGEFRYDIDLISLTSKNSQSEMRRSLMITMMLWPSITLSTTAWNPTELEQIYRHYWYWFCTDVSFHAFISIMMYSESGFYEKVRQKTTTGFAGPGTQWLLTQLPKLREPIELKYLLESLQDFWDLGWPSGNRSSPPGYATLATRLSMIWDSFV